MGEVASGGRCSFYRPGQRGRVLTKTAHGRALGTPFGGRHGHEGETAKSAKGTERSPLIVDRYE